MSLSELRVFGRSGTPISPLTLGTMNFGEGPGSASDSAAANGAPTGADDSIRIIQSLSTDSKMRTSLVQQAAKFAEGQPADVPAVEKLRNFKDAVADLGGTGIPIGWNDASSQRLFQGLPQPRNILSAQFWRGDLFSRKTLGVFGLWFTALTGWLITTLAASFGAPFWFDTLNKVIDIRGVGRAPEEKDPTAPKKKPNDGKRS